MSSLAGSACLEKRLLVLCAHAEIDWGIAAEIREVAGERLDWDYVVSQADEHSMILLLDRALRKAVVPAPGESGATLNVRARENAVRCLAFSAELVQVMELFESRGIAALPYKGPVIAVQAYGDISARQFEDLDLVLRQRDIPAADDAIRALGYEARLPIRPGQGSREVVPGEYNYSHPARRMMVELHSERTLRHFPVSPNLDPFFERAVRVNLGGREVSTFCAEDALVMLCVHGAKDFWERLIWIADIVWLLSAHPELDWDLVRRTVEPLRAERILRAGLALAAQLLDAKLPPEVSAGINADSHAMSLAADVEKRLLARTMPPRGAAERFRFRRQMVEGAGRGWLYSIRLTLAPAEEDWEGARLPGPFAPLYAALRPFRLLRKYGWMSKT